MELDKNGKLLLNILLNDTDTLFVKHISDYLAGKTGISISQVDYQIKIFVENGLANWEQTSDGKILKVNPSASSELLKINEQRKKEKLMLVQNWVWPVIVTAIGCLLSAWLSK